MGGGGGDEFGGGGWGVGGDEFGGGGGWRGAEMATRLSKKYLFCKLFFKCIYLLKLNFSIGFKHGSGYG